MDEPRERFVEANRLRHHLLEWGDTGPIVLLLHGLMEHAHAWDWVAPRIAAGGYRVFALDWRGHGDSEWVGRGGYYHFADYTADLAFVVRHLGGRVTLIGHSMGGNAALTYTGTEPDRVAGLVVIEGTGPPDSTPGVAPERFAQWIADLERAATTSAREVSLEDAASRLRTNFAAFSEKVARHMALHGTRPVGSAGVRTWKFDPLHRTRSPQPYYAAQARAFWARISCPVLYVEGTRSFISALPAEITERVSEIGAERVTLDGAGHHPHLEQPETTARVLLDFLARLPD